MDPLTQGVIGSLAARTFVGRKRKKSLALAIMGGLSALTPDLDVLIKSPTDHLLFLEYHRQFTHSLFLFRLEGSYALWLCGLSLGLNEFAVLKFVFQHV